MKNLHATLTPADTAAHVRTLWKTDLFLDSHDDERGWVHNIIARFARLPRLWCELTEPKMERSHFLTWMGVIPHRDEYDNAAISDLYYLHEYIHAADIVYGPDDDDETFARRIWENERDASLGSEVFVYFALPGLRDETFAFEIWADRFLRDPKRVAQFVQDHDGFVAFFERERARAMSSPTEGDDNERLISAYDDANHAWAKIWRGRWREVERAMADFEHTSASDRQAAVDGLSQFLRDAKGQGVCPYEDEARAYAADIQRLLR